MVFVDSLIFMNFHTSPAREGGNSPKLTPSVVPMKI